MVARAFILVETAVGKNREVVAAFRGLEGVSSCESVNGAYDVIAVVEAETLNQIGDILAKKIRPIPGIYRTVTCLAAR